LSWHTILSVSYEEEDYMHVMCHMRRRAALSWHTILSEVHHVSKETYK
jgi:hypothetical protein